MLLISLPFILPIAVQNLALNQNVSVSGEHPGEEAERAVDGVYGAEECKTKYFHSLVNEPGKEEWLRVDFGGWKHVMFVEIRNINTVTSGMGKISNSQLYVYRESSMDNRQLCAEIIDGAHLVFNLPCVKTLYGKGIELYYPPVNQVKRIIHICEIIVLGY